MGAFFVLCSAIILSFPMFSHSPKTTLILLENNSSHNAVVVSTNEGNLTVDKPYSYTTLQSADKAPSPIQEGNREEIEQKYAQQLTSLPTAPVSMLFHFEPGTADLTESSKNQVEELIQIIASRAPASIDIIGHSDREGEAQQNYLLALERAKSVETYLLSRQVKLEKSTITSYGESDPIVPTEDGVSEPQNRRVEVIVR
ncbi:MAG: OmpA family protein [Sulfuricurvum sp.]|uniref:OmpA family protein n=1 Tax=Sulfuricurvum sp. TaxID=2025608 RepID=UPI0026271CFD|nr:OmpA family protein [Sulfuricurvum sp.]MDD2828495.1 OmpA family protein [Sulfuricurvum sp.]MDD4948974.1 OmpA family protein [Sulfuricurvum sp.]